jgi:acetyl esterase/lipase
VSADILELPAPEADERIPYGDNALQFGDLRLPPGRGPHPVVTFLHGGFWRAQYDLTHTGHACAALTAHGIATWNIEYRRIGDDGGGWPGTFHDVAQGFDFLRDLAPRYIPLGAPLHRRGRLRPYAAISLAGIVDLCAAWELRLRDGIVSTFLGGTPEEVPERYQAGSPAELLPFATPQVLIHGTEDASVPYSMSMSYCLRAAGLGDPVSLTTLKGSDHFGMIDPRSQDWEHVLAAVLRLLG